MTATRKPTEPRNRGGRRVVGVDAARGVALLGMMAVHLLPASVQLGGLSISGELARGRSSAAFAVLAGVALALAYGGQQPLQGSRRTSAATALLVRCVLIGLLGLALGELNSGLAVILTYYALLFALAVPLLGLGWRPLAAGAIAATVIVPVVSHLVRAGLPGLRGPSPSFPDLAEPGTLFTELTLTGYYPALAWTAYLAAGMAVGRLDLTSLRVATGLLTGGAGLAVVTTMVSGLLVEQAVVDGDLRPSVDDEVFFGTTPAQSWWWLTIIEPHSGTPFDLLATTGSSFALLGLALLVTPLLGKAMVPLAWFGGMTLTLYAVHVLAVASQVGPADPVDLYVAHVVVGLLIACAWRSLWPRGPLEHLVSSVSQAAARRSVT